MVRPKPVIYNVSFEMTKKEWEALKAIARKDGRPLKHFIKKKLLIILEEYNEKN